MYINALPAILDHPLTGLGLGGIRVGFYPYATSLVPVTFRTETTVVRELHNEPLQYFVELGLPGGLLVIYIYYILIRRGFRNFSEVEAANKKYIVFGLWLGILACGVHALVDFPLRLPSSAAMFWLFAGILLGLDTSRTHTLSPQATRLLRPSFAIMSIGLLTFSIFFYATYLSANNDLYKAIVQGKRGECYEAVAAIESGLNKFPQDFMILTAYAQVYTYCDFPVEKKLAAMTRVLDYDSTNLFARLTRANLYIQANNPSAAFGDFSLVAKSLPHRPAAYSGLGDVAVLEKNYAVALRYYQAALKRDQGYQHATQMIQRIKASSTEYK
jgi:tetratricopeptide (TPR) repeat protein